MKNTTMTYFVFILIMEADFQNCYIGKRILAPMVRMNSLPFRLLALDNGADIVYSEEIIDYKLLRSKRFHNDILNTFDYIDCTDGSLVFRTCSREKDKVVFQIGTSNPERAAKAAAMVEKDVAAIDINMGCPKHFSVSGGMGAALLSNKSNAQKIIEHVRRTVSVPVTCKIRVLQSVEETIEFCKLMQNSGISAIAVHGRIVSERPRHENRNSVIKSVSSSLSIPVIANGDSGNINHYDDIIKFQQDTKCASVMIARAAQYNVSIFRKGGKLPLDYVITAYLNYAVKYNNYFPNTKYCVQSMLRDQQNTPLGKLFLETQSMEQLCKIWGLDEYCRQKLNEFKNNGLHAQHELSFEDNRKKIKLDLGDMLTLRYNFNRSNFSEDSDLPKSLLLKYSQKHLFKPPKYNTWNMDKLFRSIVTYNGKKYSSTYWEKNKKSAEQGAAAVCLCYLKVYDQNELYSKGIIS